jgi:hypothetical protein
MNTPEFPLLRLPAQVELTLCLIREELKSHQFFSRLRQAGLDDVCYQTDLGPLVLAQMGLHDERNATLDFYHGLLEKHCQYLQPQGDALTQAALLFYFDLLQEQRQRQHGRVAPGG